MGELMLWRLLSLMCWVGMLVAMAAEATVTPAQIQKLEGLSLRISNSDELDVNRLLLGYKDRLNKPSSKSQKIELLKWLMVSSRYIGDVKGSLEYSRQLRTIAGEDEDVNALIDFITISADLVESGKEAAVQLLDEMSTRYNMEENLRQKIYYDIAVSRASLYSPHSFFDYQVLLNHYQKVVGNPNFKFETYLILWQLLCITYDLDEHLQGVERLMDYAEANGFGVDRSTLLYNFVDKMLVSHNFSVATTTASDYLRLVLRMNMEGEKFYAYFVSARTAVYSGSYAEAEEHLELARKNMVKSKMWRFHFLILEALINARMEKIILAREALNKVEQHQKNNSSLNLNHPDLIYARGLVEIYGGDPSLGVELLAQYRWETRAIAVEEQYGKLRAVRQLLKDAVAGERVERAKSETLLADFQVAVIALLLVLAAVVVLIVRQYRITRQLLKSEIRLSQANQRLERRNQTDGLTKLKTKVFWESRLKQEFARMSRRPDSSSCLILLDIDYFKNVNDSYGHPMGDRVIQAVAKVIRLANRKSDIAGRIGGEEFAVLLPDTNSDSAFQFAERIRQEIRALNFDSSRGSFGCSVSLGVAQFDAEYASAIGWLECADSALYQAKRGGRDNTKIYSRQALVQLA